MARVIITGGGTAGHTNPGIAIAQALVSLGLAVDDVHFIGGVRGNEQTLVPAAGFSIDLLPGRGIKRSLSFDNLRTVLDLARAVRDAHRLLRRHRPEVVVCLGGYASFGASLAAIVQRIPVVVSEQNARASLVNRVVGRFAAACAIPFPDTDLPNAVLTGNPVRPAVVEAVRAGDREASRAARRFDPDRTVVMVLSGSLGANSVNRAVRRLAHEWRDRSDVIIHHIVGRRDWSEFGDTSVPGAIDYRTVEYEDDVPSLLVAADVAVCRAGASTVTELAIAGLPAVLVPLPGAPRDHQRANTRELVEAGGAVLVDDQDLSASTLAAALGPMIADPDRRAAMARAAASVGRPDAASAVAELVLEVAGDGAPGDEARRAS